MKKRTALAALLTLSMLAMTACGASSGSGASASTAASEASSSTAEASGDAGSEASAPADGEGLVIAGLWVQEDQAGYWYERGFQDACDEAGAELLFSISGTPEREEELLGTYTLSGVDGICMCAVSEIASEAIIRNLVDEHGIPVSNFVATEATDYTVGGALISHTDLGASLAPAAIKFIKEEMGGTVKLGVVTFKSQFAEPAAQRMNGFVDLLMADPDIDVEVVAEGEAWMTDMAVQVAGDMLTAHPEITMLYGCNEGGTIGSTLAVKNAGLEGQVYVFGIDCGEQQVAMLKDSDNILQACSAQDYYSVGYVSMQKLIQFINTGDESLRAITEIQPIVVDRADPDSIASYEEIISQ